MVYTMPISTHFLGGTTQPCRMVVACALEVCLCPSRATERPFLAGGDGGDAGGDGGDAGGDGGDHDVMPPP